MPQVRGLPADGVRRVSLLQGHEEIWRPRAHEAELHHAAVHRGECMGCMDTGSYCRMLGFPASCLLVCLALEELLVGYKGI